MSAQETHQALIDSDVPLTGTARVGAELRQVRERAGWNLAEVAAELRIREPFLDAIERGALEALPGPAYQAGFVRSYAQILGLDGEEILRRFRAEGLGAAKKPELSFLAPVPDRAVPSGAIVLLGVVVLLVGYGLWFLHTENDKTLAASVPAVPAELAPLAIPPAPPQKPAAPQVAQAASQAKAATAPSGTVPAAPVAEVAAPPATSPAPSAPALAKAAATPAAGTPAAGTPGKTILATADSWVEVKDQAGNILFSRLMHSGDSWPIPDLPGLTMTSGNAGGTEIADDGNAGHGNAGHGNAGQPLGVAGAVLRDYALTPAGQAPAGAAGAAGATPAAAKPSTVAQNPAKATP